jgi:hypothetical protein
MRMSSESKESGANVMKWTSSGELYYPRFSFPGNARRHGPALLWRWGSRCNPQVVLPGFLWVG